MQFFLILNPDKFVPPTAHIKHEINFINPLEHRFIKEVSLIALNEKFTIQEINLDKKRPFI